ncbi:MAG: ATP12 chaperone family protein [Micavibrio sp.]|nr:ATP12 chaperone family protein [Micavibrio sp.]
MKKFYKLVSTLKDDAANGWHVMLDKRPVKCPSGATLLAPSEDMAFAIAAEWSAQQETIIPDSMPITQILTTCLDRVARERAAMESAVLKYIDTDLICYRAGDEPPGQREAQEQAWDKWVDWFEEHFDSRLETTSAITALNQPPLAHQLVASYIADLDDHHFTAFQLAVSASGSLVLGLAFIKHAITPEDLFAAAHVEEDFKGKIYDQEKYGLDPMEQSKRDAMMRDLKAAHRYLQLLSA